MPDLSMLSQQLSGGVPPNQMQTTAASSSGLSSSDATMTPPPAPQGGIPASMLPTSLSGFASNPYFTAGAGLYALTMMGFVGRYATMMMKTAIQRRYLVSIETTNRDPSYDWLIQWLARHPKFNCQQLSLMTKDLRISGNDATEAKTTFGPAPNIPHLLFHKGWPFIIYRKRQVERAQGADVLEMIEISSFGRGSARVQEIVAEARAQAHERESDKTVIYRSAGGQWMRNSEPRARKPLQSVVLDGNLREELIGDVTQFLASQDYYLRLGVPYRRGYLLHGPPGCGKSSLVLALAGELRLAICVLSLSARNLDDESLNSLLNSAPLNSIVLLEDIDRAFTSESRVTMSGLLNALDGVDAQEGRIVFMTTNHVQKLDAALIRPGRADVKMEIGLMTQTQILHFFAKFFPDATTEQAVAFTRAIPQNSISPAQLQSHLFLHRSDPEAATKSVAQFIEEIQRFEEHVRKRAEMQRKAESIRGPPIM